MQTSLQSFYFPSASTELLIYIDYIPLECTSPNIMSCISFHRDAYFGITNEIMHIRCPVFVYQKAKQHLSDLLAR